MENTEFKRGDIVFVDNPLKEQHGHVAYGNHPAVIIQNNMGNTYSSNLIVAFLTSKLKRTEMTTHVVLQWYPGLRKTSMIQAEQLATIDKGDVLSYAGHLRDEDMYRLDQALMASLAIGEVS